MVANDDIVLKYGNKLYLTCQPFFIVSPSYSNLIYESKSLPTQDLFEIPSTHDCENKRKRITEYALLSGDYCDKCYNSLIEEYNKSTPTTATMEIAQY